MAARVRSVVGGLVALWLLAAPAGVHAQAQPSPVKPDYKATVGLGLVGAELGFVLPAAAGLDQTWAFIVFPILGAGGGGAAGYFLIEKGTDSSELSVAMLATGMALIIPSMILTLQWTAYDPDDEIIDARAAPPAFVQVTERGVGLGPPSVGYAVDRESGERQLSVSLLSGRL